MAMTCVTGIYPSVFMFEMNRKLIAVMIAHTIQAIQLNVQG